VLVVEDIIESFTLTVVTQEQRYVLLQEEKEPIAINATAAAMNIFVIVVDLTLKV
jgi:hypothetical protein